MDVQDMTDKQWQQCTLKLNQGGLGIGVADHTAHSAYAASFLSTFNDIETILPNLRNIISNPLENNTTISTIQHYVTSIRIINYKNTYDEVTALTLIPTNTTTSTNTTNKLQSLFTNSKHQQQYTNFIETIKNDKYYLAAFLSSATPEGSSALLATPKSSALKLTPLEFKTVINIRLRADISIIPNLKCSCSRHTDVDNKGDHLSVCKKGKEIYAIHDAIKQVIAVLCRSNGLYARVEPTNLFRIHDPDDNKSPDIEVLGTLRLYPHLNPTCLRPKLVCKVAQLPKLYQGKIRNINKCAQQQVIN